MAERTGGHQRDTGPARSPIAATGAHLAEGAAQAAYRAYVSHAHNCEACRASDFQCDTAAELWAAYRAIR